MSQLISDFKYVSQRLLNEYIDITEPEIIQAMNSALKSGKCGLLIEVNTKDPFAVSLIMKNGDGDKVNLISLVESENTIN